MRILLAARLSQGRQGQTGIDTQDTEARRWAERNGHQIVAVAADRISGRVAPSDRPNLGPWLKQPERMAQYDAVMASKIDRFTRGRDWAMRQWAEDQGKRLIVVSPELYWPPAPGDTATAIIWDTLVNVASGEWESTSQRYRTMQTYLRESGYFVGRPPFGYQIVRHGEHKSLAPDAELVPYVRGAVQMALDGQPLAHICRWLDNSGVVPKQGGAWSPRSLALVLRNPVLMGRRTDSTGRTILKVPPVIDAATFRRLQTKLDNNPYRRGPTRETPALLTGILYCARCEGIMHARNNPRPRKDGSVHIRRRYRCDGTHDALSRCRNTIRRDDLDGHIYWMMSGGLEGIGDLEIIERVTIPGSGYEDEIAEVTRDIHELTARLTADELSEDDFDSQMRELRAERKRLRSLPADPDRVEERRTGRTVAEHWKSLDEAGRRRYLLSCGLKFYAVKDDSGELQVGAVGPANVVDQLERG